MASASILFLRPPPNVEFVQGFPGIPAATPERQACVRGVVELRPGGSAIKARFVKIELRKVETLPGGGQANTYIDFIGESPLMLWQAANEWDELRARDFPFQIRMPEALPPSIALERNAGIKYELVASVLTKGKRGLLRRESTPTVSTSCQIIVDKHELHSAWPIYAQPESRSRTMDGYTLTVNRTHTAYGPGDRIAVQTLIKNDTMQSNQVRYYEFSLLQHVAYRTSPQAGGKRNGPPPRTSAIQEQRIPITMASPLHPGMQVKAELSLQVPFNHTTTTVLWAMRIEVSFAIHVKAVLAGGQQLLLDLPITMSNWTRAQSIDAVRRIGIVPNLSLQPAARPPSVGAYGQTPPAQVPPMPGMNWSSPPPMPEQAANRPVSSMPNGMGHGNGDFVGGVGGWADQQQQQQHAAATMGGAPPRPDMAGEFGIMSPAGGAMARPFSTMGGVPSNNYQNGPSTYNPNQAAEPRPPSVPNGSDDGRAQTAGGRNRRPLTGGSNPTARFTVVNVTADPEDAHNVNGHPPGGSSVPPVPQNRYVSAEEEKRRLREAMDRVDRENVQVQPPAPVMDAGGSGSGSASAPPAANTQQPKYLSAEAEKAQLAQQRQMFEGARERALRLQQGTTPDATDHSWDQQNGARYSTPPPMANGSSPATSPPQRQGTQWLSAAEEKERLFSQARNAVERTQGMGGGSASARAPVSQPSMWAGDTSFSSDTGGSNAGGVSAGKALYQSAMASMRPSQSAYSAYPNGGSSNGNGGPGPYLTAADEKEAMRFKRALEAAKSTQMGASYMGGKQQQAVDAGPVPYEDLFPGASTAPIAPLNVSRSRSATSGRESVYGPSGGSSAEPPRPLNAREEKDRMKQLYDAQDSAARQPGGAIAAGGSLVPPPHFETNSASQSPPASQTPRVLSAVEEKAMLRAKYANEASSQSSAPIPPPIAAPPPPPNPYANYGQQEGVAQTNGYHHNDSALPPAFSAAPAPISAADEKAQLRARYAAEDAAPASSQTANRGPPPIPPPPRKPTLPPAPSPSAPDYYEQDTGASRDPYISMGKQRAPTPPPLPSKPPAEYYQHPDDTPAANSHDFFGSPQSPQSQDSSASTFIDVRPFSPFSIDYSYNAIPPPPPLPPKPIM